MGEPVRFKGKRHPEREEALQWALNLDDAPVDVRLWLNAKLRAEHDKYSDDAAWSWLMLGKVGPMLNDLTQAINKGPRGKTTFAVWTVLPQFLKVDDGLLLCTQTTLSKAAGVPKPHVNFALKRLAEIGALQELGDGKYRVHPELMWHGRLAKREEAAAKAPPLALGKKRKLALVGT